MEQRPLRVVFFGTPEFSVPFLQTLLQDKNFSLVGVVTQPDKLVGRSQTLTPSPVKVLALQSGIPVFEFSSLKTKAVKQTLSSLKVDCFVVVSYGKIIPQSILSIPPLGCVNVHPSLLPKYRGPSPIQTAIVNGDAQTAVSIMLLDSGMDTGPILGQKTVAIKVDDTFISLSARLQEVGCPFLVEILCAYASDKIKPIPQNNTEASTTSLLDRESGKINLQEPEEEIDRKTRAYYPWPGCYTIIKHNGKELRVKLLPNHFVQPEGKKPMALEAFELGYGSLKQ